MFDGRWGYLVSSPASAFIFVTYANGVEADLAQYCIGILRDLPIDIFELRPIFKALLVDDLHRTLAFARKLDKRGGFL